MKTQIQLNFANRCHISQRPSTSHWAGKRSGFTVIELVVVVMVIAILAAMLLPAISGARNTARNAQVTIDIKNLEAAIANFKLKFGVEPPSSFLLGKSQSHYTSSAIGRNSLAIMRQIWPDYNPAYTDMIYTNGMWPGVLLNLPGTDPVYLNGAECLVFFLGGAGMIYDPSVPDGIKNVIPVGFSANPANPFAAGGTRVGPFYEFNLARLVDIDSPPDGCPELIDPLPNQTKPYQYLSSYGGRGYQPLGFDKDTADGTTEKEDFKLDDEAIAPLSRAYFQSFRPAGNLYGYWNPKGYQIISPGRDGEYGSGGGYRDGKFFNDDATQTSRDSSAKTERDNITNFSGGPLQP